MEEIDKELIGVIDVLIDAFREAKVATRDDVEALGNQLKETQPTLSLALRHAVENFKGPRPWCRR